MEELQEGGVAPPKGRAKACTACRQVKLKCDARELYPHPCTRCKTQNLECRMDPTFKRVPARRQLEEVSNRLINLQRSLGLNEDSGLPSAPVAPQSQPRFDRLSDQPHHETTRRESAGQESNDSFTRLAPETKWLDLDDEKQEGHWTLGDVTLTYPQVLSLFQHFDALLFRHIPILEPCRSLHGLYKYNDLLFWTIILASCRLFNQWDETYNQLLPHHRALIPVRAFGTRSNIGMIHALLILCTWPYPVNSQYDDITWVLCGAANNMAMLTGLHKPEHGHEYLLNYTDPAGPAPQTRKLTWLACFQISTSIASWLGLPPSLGSTAHLETIDTLCQDASLPKAYRAKVDIQRQLSRFINALDVKLDFRTRYSLIKLYEQDLERVQSMFEDAWSDLLEVDYLGAKLFLYGMAFINNSTQKETEVEAQTRAAGAREVLQHGLACATKMLNVISNLRLQPTPPGENKTGTSDFVYQVVFFPKQFFRLGAFAAFFLLWYLAVDVQASESDRNLAREHVTFTYQLLYSVSHSPEHLRAARSIEMMARFGSLALRHRPQASNLVVNSRLGASFMYSLNYTEDDSADTRVRLLDMPPMLGIDSVGGTSSAAGSTPSHTAAGPSASSGADGTWRVTEVNSPGSVGAGGGVAGSLGRSSVLEGHTQSTPPALGVQAPQQPPGGGIQPSPGPQQPATPFGAQQQQQQGQGQQQGAGVRSPMPPYDPNGIFSNAFFQDAGNQNLDFLWQEWDPAVFGELKMDVDVDEGMSDMSDMPQPGQFPRTS